MKQPNGEISAAEKYILAGEHGDGPELPLCVLIELLDETSFYTTRDAALTRYKPSDRKGERGPFEKMRDRLGYYLRKRKTEPDRLVRDGALIEVIPDEEGEIRGNRAFRGSTIKNLMKPRGRMRGKLGVRLLRCFYELTPQNEYGQPLDNLMQRLNKCRIDQLEKLVIALERNQPSGCPMVDELVEHLNRLSKLGLAHLLHEFGHQPFEPGLFGDSVPHSLRAALQSPPSLEQEPETESGVRTSSVPKEKQIPQWLKKRRKPLALIALAAIAFTAFQRVHLYQAIEILKMEGIGSAYQFVLNTSISRNQSHENFRDLAFIYLRANRFEEAKRTIYSLLAEPDLSPKLHADCYLVLGHAMYASGNFRTALGMFFEAYQNYSTPARKNHSALGMAKAHLALGEMDLFEQRLQEAIELDEASQGEGNQLEMYYLSQVRHLKTRDYEAALEDALSQWALFENSEDNDRANEARVNLAMAYAFHDDLEKAQSLAFQAGSIAKEMGDQEKWVYNLITHIVTNNKLGIPPPQYALDQINERITEQADKHLALLLQLALNP